MIIFVILVFLLLLSLGLIYWACYNQSNNYGAQEKSQKIEEETCQLIEKTKLNHDTYKLKFAFPSKMNDKAIKVGQYITLQQNIQILSHPNEDKLNNKYFPINIIEQKGKFEILVKVWTEFEIDSQNQSKTEQDNQNESKNEQDNQIEKDNQNRSNFNSWIEKMIPGDSALIKIPFGSFFYFGYGRTLIIQVPLRRMAQYKRIVMIAYGQGITPMYQIIQAVANRSSDKTKLQLLYANKTQQDILLYNELKAFEASKKLTLHLTLDKPHASWMHSSGFVTSSMIQNAFGTIDKYTLALVCGPPKMRQLIGQIFHELNVDSKNFYMFT